jgi:hypothetical protein
MSNAASQPSSLDQPSRTDFPPPTALEATFELVPSVALPWIDRILATSAEALGPQDVIYLLRCRADLAGTLPFDQRLQRERPHPLCEGLLRTGVRQVVQHERAQATAQAQARYGKAPTKDKLLEELAAAAFAPTNLLGTISASAQLLDSVYHSLPATWHVRLQGGTWELYDANKTARTHAFGKHGKARYPVRMVLRARAARMNWLASFRSTPKGMVASIPAGSSFPRAMKLTGANTFKPISKAVYSALPVRGIIGSNAVGLAITMGPQAIVDAHAAGLFSDPSNSNRWKDFAISSAKNQSGNLAGVAAGFAAGGFVLAGALILGTAGVAAPIMILAGLAGGIGGQAAFNAWGWNEKAEEAARSLLGR